VRSARARAFSPEVVQAFFASDDAQDQYTAGRMEALNDPRLSAAQRAARIADLRAQLPAELQERMGATELVGTLDTLTEQWRQAGGTPEQLRQLRENLVGKEAAERLAALDEQTRAFDARVAAHLAWRDQLLADPSLAELERQRQLAARRQLQFGPEEQVRVNALEHIHDETRQLASSKQAERR
jgi:lipase chaperone LimK